jgi:predicted SprT family Zn-dependent metalloprotease
LDLFDAEILAKELISSNVPHYQFGWNSRKTVYGLCSYERKTIYLSRHLTKLATVDRITKIVMHEIAHAMHSGDGHGRKWKAQMRAFGLSPDRCVTISDLDTRSISNWQAKCRGCGKVTYMIRKPRAQRSCGPCSGNAYSTKYELTYERI